MATAHDITAPSFGQLYEEALRKFKAVAAITHLLSNDEGTDEVLLDAANHAWQVAHDGAELMPQLWERHGAEFERKPEPATDDGPLEWTGASADVEMKALGARILALPDYAARHVMDFALNVVTAHRSVPNHPTLDEIGSMLKRGVTLQSINSFWHLKSQGVAAFVPEAPREELERRATAIGFKLIDEPDDGGITIEKIDDPEGEGLVGGSLQEAVDWIAAREAVRA